MRPTDPGQPLAPATLTRRRALAHCLPLLACAVPLVHAQTELTDLARIRATGTLKVAVYKDNPPFAEGAASGMQGLDVALAGALARAMNLGLTLLAFDADENMDDDLRNMVWKGHYLGFGPADVMLQVPVDLKGVNIAAERGTGAASAVMGYDGGLLRNQVHIVNSGTEAGEAVLKGQAVAAYLTRAQAEAAMFRAGVQPGRFELSTLALNGVPNNGWPVGMAVKKSNQELAQALVTALQSLRDSGELLKLFQQQGLTLTAP